MKRLFCFMLVVIMALSLAACGTKATEDDLVKKESSSAAEEISTDAAEETPEKAGVTTEDFIGVWIGETVFDKDFGDYKAGDPKVLTVTLYKGGTSWMSVADGEGNVIASGSAEWKYVGDNIVNVVSGKNAGGYELQNDGTLRGLFNDVIYVRQEESTD